MTVSNFAQALKLVLVHEGGFADHPDDPGGATMKGVTQAVYDAYRVGKGLAVRSVKSITNAELNAIYERQYWQAIRGDELPSGVDYCVFDYAVNSGPGRAVKDLQRALGVKVDGVVGMGTMNALTAADDAKLINEICDKRLKFLKSLRIWKTFGVGWERRVKGVRAAALEMVRGEAVSFVSMPLVKQGKSGATKGTEDNQAQLKTADGVGLSATTAGGVGQTVMERAQEMQPHIGDSILGRAAIAAFVLLMAVGLGLLAFAQIKRIREKGGLGGYIGSVFK